MENRKINISITLPADCGREIFQRLERDGLAVEDLLAGFLRDLSGIHSNGSDETEQARGYFERCCYEFSRGNTFTEWLARSGCLLRALEHCENIETASDYLPIVTDLKQAAVQRASMEDSLQDLRQLFEEYAEEARNEGESLQSWPDAWQGLQDAKARYERLAGTL